MPTTSVGMAPRLSDKMRRPARLVDRRRAAALQSPPVFHPACELEGLPVHVRPTRVFLCVLTLAAAQSAAGLEVRVTQNTRQMMPYQVFELTFQHDGQYHNPDLGRDHRRDVHLAEREEARGRRILLRLQQAAEAGRPRVEGCQRAATDRRHLALRPGRPVEGPLCPERAGRVEVRLRLPQQPRARAPRASGTFRVVKGRVHQTGLGADQPGQPATASSSRTAARSSRSASRTASSTRTTTARPWTRGDGRPVPPRPRRHQAQAAARGRCSPAARR